MFQSQLFIIINKDKGNLPYDKKVVHRWKELHDD